MSTKRIRRPTPARTAPRRDWTPALGASAPPRSAARDDAGAPTTPGGTRERIEATVSKSVELGYKVIDEYLQQGQHAAQRLNAGTLTAEAVATEAQDLGTRVARYASDFFGAWMELLELAAAGRVAQGDARAPAAPAPPPSGAATAPDAPAPARTTQASRLQVELATSRPVRLRLDFHADRVRGALRAHALRSADPSRGQLQDVACEMEGDAPLLRVEVSPKQRAGSYEGLLVDETTNRPVGSVRVTLEETSPQPRASSKARASSASPSSKPSSKRR